MEGKELPNEESIKKFSEKVNSKHLGILEADTIIKQIDKRRITEEQKKTPGNQSLQQKSHQRNKHLGSLSS